MLKKEVRDSIHREQPKKKSSGYIAVLVSPEERTSFKAAAEECNCSVGEYIRRLHKYSQGN